MSDCVKETLCTSCIHRSVCSYKNDYLNAVRAVNEVSMSWKDLKCIGDISVNCIYHQNLSHEIKEYCLANNLR